MKQWVAVVLMGLLTGCRGPAPEAAAPAPAPVEPGWWVQELWRAAGGPVVGLATVRVAGEQRLLALGQDGASRFLGPAGESGAGPFLLPGATHLTAADLDGDGTDELLVAGPGRLAAIDLGGRPIWDQTFAGAAVYGLAAGVLAAGERPAVVVVGLPPLGARAFRADGTPLWTDATARTAYAAALSPAGTEPGRALILNDNRLLTTHDPTGRKLATARTATTRGRELVAMDLALAGGRLLLVGRIDGPDADRGAWVLTGLDGRPVADGELGFCPPVHRTAALAADFRGDGRVLAVAIDRDGRLVWLGPEGLVGETEGQGRAVLTVALGPVEKGRPTVVAGLVDGVVAWGWAR